MARTRNRRSHGHTRRSPPTRQIKCRINRLGHQGDGIADIDGRAVYIPYTLAGETVEAEVRGDRGELIEITEAAPERIAPHCPKFGDCGGCAVQHATDKTYKDWKRGVVMAALRNRDIDAPVAGLVDAHGAGRRRLTVHVTSERGRLVAGFNRRRGRAVVNLDACPLLAVDLHDAFRHCRAIADAVGDRRRDLDIRLTATDTGLDVDVRGLGDMGLAEHEALAAWAAASDFARLTVNGEPLAERRTPVLRMDGITLMPPPGGFLQATADGEAVLASLVLGAVPTDGLVADLFCGVGPFALRLAARQPVVAMDSDRPALAALDRAVRMTSGLKPIRVERRDLYDQPLQADELIDMAAVVFDPPRTGAEVQAAALAESEVPIVVGVSCNPVTFARDAEMLIDGGYRLAGVTPVDQFRHAAHVELVGIFQR